MQYGNDYDTEKYIKYLEEIEYTKDKDAFLDVLLQLWERYPNYRFGQLLKHISGEVGSSPYFLPDGIFQQTMEKCVDEGFRGIDRIVRNSNAEREWTGYKKQNK